MVFRVRRAVVGAMLAAVVLSTIPVPSRAESAPVVAVLSSDLNPYQRAYDGMQEVFEKEVPKKTMKTTEPGVSRDIKVVAAFGGKAALADYPKDAALVYGMAPGVWLDPAGRPGRTVAVRMFPDPLSMLKRYKLIQPNLKRLAVVWMSDAMGEYVRALEPAGKSAGIEIVSCRVEDIGRIAAALRSIKGAADALWLSPDPLLVNTQTFTVFNDFCWGNNIPFYVAIDGFVERGATASIFCEYREIGRAMGDAAKRLLAGEPVEETIYLQKTFLSINTAAIEHLDLRIAPDVLRTVDKRVP